MISISVGASVQVGRVGGVQFMPVSQSIQAGQAVGRSTDGLPVRGGETRPAVPRQTGQPPALLRPQLGASRTTLTVLRGAERRERRLEAGAGAGSGSRLFGHDDRRSTAQSRPGTRLPDTESTAGARQEHGGSTAGERRGALLGSLSGRGRLDTARRRRRAGIDPSATARLAAWRLKSELHPTVAAAAAAGTRLIRAPLLVICQSGRRLGEADLRPRRVLMDDGRVCRVTVSARRGAPLPSMPWGHAEWVPVMNSVGPSLRRLLVGNDSCH